MSDLLQQEMDRSTVDVGSNTRHEIVLLAPEGCRGVELGVSTGQLSERFIATGHLSELHAVDKWDDHAHSRYQYLAVAKKLMPYKEARVWRMTAQEFANLVPDEYFGFIYIDCYAHTGQDNGEVLRAFWPKLQVGGLFSGDDYDRRAWPKTVRAVDDFARELGVTVNVRDEFCRDAKQPYDRHPSWYWYK